MPKRLPDISKIQQLIGYQPTLYLPEMLVTRVRLHFPGCAQALAYVVVTNLEVISI
jgi:hypothetical protein